MANRNYQPFRQTRGIRGGRTMPSSSASPDSCYQPPHNRTPNPRRNERPVNNTSSGFNRSNGNNKAGNREMMRDGDIIDKSDEDSYSSMVGTCPFMCPVEERLRRERLRDLAIFERLHGDRTKSSPSLAAKKFCRTISTRDSKASDLRPLLVLEETLNYLLSLFHSEEHHFEVVHDFIFDRTRSIRQDLSMQNISSKQAIVMYERMVKFHIISHQKLYRSCGSPNTSSLLYLNLEQLNKSMMTLFNLYEANRTSNTIHENEAEFRSIYVLLQINPDSKGGPLSLWFRGLHSVVMKSKQMRFALEILRCFHLGNYKRFMHLLETEASTLQYSIVEPYINEVRALAVCYLNQAGYKLQPFSLEYISGLLLLEEPDAESFCKDCGLEIFSDEVGKKFLPPKQPSFCRPKNGFQKYYPFHCRSLPRLSVEFLDI